MNRKSDYPRTSQGPTGQPPAGRSVAQLTLFGMPGDGGSVAAGAPDARGVDAANGQQIRVRVRKGSSLGRRRLQEPGFLNPHLLAARRLAKAIGRLPERSPEETRTGLAICRELKAFLGDGTDRPH